MRRLWMFVKSLKHYVSVLASREWAFCYVTLCGRFLFVISQP